MDAQNFRSLQEAYMKVVENQQLDEGYKNLGVVGEIGMGAKAYRLRGEAEEDVRDAAKRSGRVDSKETQDAIDKGVKKLQRSKKIADTLQSHNPETAKSKEAENRARGAKNRAFGNRLRRADGQGIRDSYDYYDIILSHLLDEGYAETLESAEKIMVNMSEEWREQIMEGLKSIDTPEKAQGYAIRALGSATKAAFTRDKKTYEKRLKGLKMGQRKAERKAAEEN